MILRKPPLPPPAPPVLFRCSSCDREARFTRDELAASGASGQGVFAWRRPCPCGAQLRRIHAADTDTREVTGLNVP